MNDIAEYRALESKKANLMEKLEKEEEKYAKEGKDFDEMVSLTRELRLELFELDKDIRMVQPSRMQYNKKWKGEKFPLEAFVVQCQDGKFSDTEGYGCYATETGLSDVKVYPSDIMEGKYRKEFPFVMWFVF